MVKTVNFMLYVYVCALSLSHVWFCDPMYSSLPGSSVHWIFQARILEWVAISYSRGIFLTWGSNPHLLHLLHWHADSLSLYPCLHTVYIYIYIYICVCVCVCVCVYVCMYMYIYINICIYQNNCLNLMKRVYRGNGSPLVKLRPRPPKRKHVWHCFCITILSCSAHTLGILMIWHHRELCTKIFLWHSFYKLFGRGRV